MSNITKLYWNELDGTIADVNDIKPIADKVDEVIDEIDIIEDDITEIRDDINEIDTSLLTGYQYLKGEFIEGSTTAQKWELWAYNGYYWVSLENNNTETPSTISTKWAKWDNRKTYFPSAAVFEMIAEKNRKYYDGSGYIGQIAKVTTSGTDDNLIIANISNGANILKITQHIKNINGYKIKITARDITLPDAPSNAGELFKQVLVFVEVWHELITEKDWWCPDGDVQYSSSTFNCDDGTIITLDLITDKLGSSYQGYSAYDTWDTSTVGYGKKWSELTDEEKISIISSKYQNIYVKGDNIYQVRYRVRVLELSSAYNNETGMEIIEAEGTAQGKTLSPSSNKFVREDANDVGLCKYESSTYSDNDYTYAISIAIVSRRDTGAYHPVYNPNGCAKFNDSGTAKYWYEYAHETTWSIDTYTIVGVNTANSQFKISGDHTDIIKEDYYITVSGSTGNDGRYYVSSVTYDSGADQTIITVLETIPDATADGSLKSDYQYVKYCFDNATGGTIESGISGRPDGLYADEINERDVRDLRLPAKTDETLYTEAGAERVMNEYIANNVRGEESLYIIPVRVYEIYNKAGVYTFRVISHSGKTGVFEWGVIDPQEGSALYLFNENGFKRLEYAYSDSNNSHFYEIADGTSFSDAFGITLESGRWNDVSDKKFKMIICDKHINGHIFNNIICNYIHNNTLLHCDIIGDPENYLQSWKDFGVMGAPLIIDEEGNDYLPDGSKTAWKLSRKYSSIKQVVKYSGGSFTLLTETTDYTLDSANNTITFASAPASTDIIMVFYETYCNALEPVANRKYKNLSNIVVTNCYDVNQGGKLVVDLINKVPIHYKLTKNLHYLNLTRIFKDYISNELLLSYQLYHESILTYYLESTNPAVKALIYITEQNGLLYPVFVFKEMKYDSTSSSWGDDNKLQITDYVSTMTDNNGKTILYGQKISKIPLGFAKNNIIDID